MSTERPIAVGTLIVDGRAYETGLPEQHRRRKRYVRPDPRQVCAVIPGVIQRLYVGEGDPVRRGDRLVVLEAMKMQNDVVSSRAGRVARLHVSVGQRVEKAQLLLELDFAE